MVEKKEFINGKDLVAGAAASFGAFVATTDFIINKKVDDYISSELSSNQGNRVSFEELAQKIPEQVATLDKKDLMITSAITVGAGLITGTIIHQLTKDEKEPKPDFKTVDNDYNGIIEKKLKTHIL